MKNVCLFFLLICVLAACKPNTSDQGAATTLPADLPAGFADFYQHFMRDSLYQMEHILFPLQGLPDHADSTILLNSNNFRWQIEDWLMHRAIDKSSGFSVNMRPITDTYIQETIFHESGVYAMERRWAYMDDGWYLIYYAGLNPVAN